MTSRYKFFLEKFHLFSTRYASKYLRLPSIYFLPVFHINRIHFSENSAAFCFSYKSSISRLILVFLALPFKSLLILFSSLFYFFSYRAPSYSSFIPRRLFLSHFIPTSNNILNHAFRHVPASDYDLHIVTSSLYVREQFNCQYFIPDDSSTVFCRPYAKPFAEIGFILSSIFSLVPVVFEFLRSKSYVARIFWLNVGIQLISFHSLIPRRLYYNLNWIFKITSFDATDAFVIHEGYSWEHSAMQFFSRLQIPVSLYCHAPITPLNLSCFRNSLPTFHCDHLYVQNRHSLDLFAARYSQYFRIPTLLVYDSVASLDLSNCLSSPPPSTLSSFDKITLLLLPENLLNEVLIFLRFIACAGDSYSFILRLHPRTSRSDLELINKFIELHLQGFSILISDSTLLDDANSSHYSLFRSSSAILPTLVGSSSTPVFLNIPNKPCPNPLFFLHSSLYLSCSSFSQLSASSFVRPSSAFYKQLFG